jgi:hypothetical protein
MLTAFDHATRSLPYPQVVLDAEVSAADPLEAAWENVGALVTREARLRPTPPPADHYPSRTESRNTRPRSSLPQP